MIGLFDDFDLFFGGDYGRQMSIDGMATADGSSTWLVDCCTIYGGEDVDKEYLRRTLHRRYRRMKNEIDDLRESSGRRLRGSRDDGNYTLNDADQEEDHEGEGRRLNRSRDEEGIIDHEEEEDYDGEGRRLRGTCREEDGNFCIEDADDEDDYDDEYWLDDDDNWTDTTD